MKVLFVLLVFLSVQLNGMFGQIPINCFEIESILADACGTPEGENEMVLFHVGSSPLNTADLFVDWPANPWRGICQNATTALKVGAMNRQIVGCGWFLEPVAGVLPVDSRVLMITSENFDTLAHDFSALKDTLWVIFQCVGNTNGHFLNASASTAYRSLSMLFNPPSSCYDTVTYDAGMLIDTNGIAGSGPSTGARNGATVQFAWDGTPTYVNDGCKPPYIPLKPNIALTSIDICEGDSVILSGTVSGGNYYYYWRGGLGTFNNDTSLVPIYYPAPGETGSFYLYLVESSSCDSLSDSILITIHLYANVILPADTMLCLGSSLLLDAGASGGSFLWSTGDTSQTITVSTGGLYYVTSTTFCNTDTDSILVSFSPGPILDLVSDTSLCAGTSILLDPGAGGGSYLWSTGDTTQSITVTSGGMYIVTGTMPCGSVSDTANVILYSTPMVDLGKDTTLCVGESITLDGSNSANSWLWSNGDTTQIISVSSAGNYFVISMNPCGADTDSISINYFSPTSVFAGNDTTLCPGDSLSLNMATSSSGTTSWTTGGSGYFADPTILNTSYFALSDSGIFPLILTLTDSCGSHSDSLWITMKENPSGLLSAPDSVCYLENILLSYSGNATMIFWSGGMGTIDSTTAFTTSYTPASDEDGWITFYTITTNDCGSIMDSISVFISDSNIADFSWTPTEIYPGTVVHFQNTSNPFNDLFNWNFGDAGTSILEDPNHTYNEPGTYPVTLEVEDALGCKATIVMNVIVLQPDTIIPNVFSPNGDGINDVLLFTLPPVRHVELVIFDRWGKRIFTTNDINVSWNGKLNGVNCAEGVYFYELRASLLDAGVISRSGNITLIR